MTASEDDRWRLKLIQTLLRNQSHLIAYLFHPDEPRLADSVERLNENGYSHGQKVIIKIALDIWSDDYSASLMEAIEVLDNNNFAALLDVILLIRTH